MSYSRKILLPLTIVLGLMTGDGIGSVGGAISTFSIALANENGRDDNAGRREGRRTTEVSVRHLVRMSPAELARYADRNFYFRREHEPVTIIAGFSEPMSAWFLKGAAAKPRVFRRLLQRLQNETDPDRRLEILNEEKRRLEAEIEARQRGIQDMSQRFDNERNLEIRKEIGEAARDEQRELHLAEVALQSVNTWIDFPQEGMRE